MLKKLIKYDFRSAGRLIGILYLAVLAVAVLVGIATRIQDSHAPAGAGLAFPGDGEIAILTIVSIYALLLAALLIVTVVMIILHFYRNLLQQEGYLMHTLPVPAWMHIASKTITAFCWMLIAGVVAALSILIVCGISGFLAEMLTDLTDLWNSIGLAVSTPTFWLFVFTGIVGCVVTILTFYLALSIGNLANKHKIFFSIVAFIVILVVMSTVQNAIGSSVLPMNALFQATDVLPDGSITPYVNRATIIQLFENIGWGILFFAGTRWILQKKLNLE